MIGKVYSAAVTGIYEKIGSFCLQKKGGRESEQSKKSKI